MRFGAIAVILTALLLVPSFAFAQQREGYCGDAVCQPDENQFCPSDCTPVDAYVAPEGFAPPKPASSAVVVGMVIIFLLVVAGYAVSGAGKPTHNWQRRHAPARKKK